ncbi:MAG TPA: alpha/beta hydrolase [Lacipirellulaceae bacterium]|nr:alpha/beta hydrolase [Lacipirellulaceae bacterium]
MQNAQCKMFNAKCPNRILHGSSRTLHVALLATLIAAIPLTAQAGEQLAITPDVVYGHKAGMALTFDVIHPKKPNGAGILVMMSGGWFSMWVPPVAFIDPKAPGYDFLKHFAEPAQHGYTVFIVRHGSAPQFKVPEAVADVRRAVRFIRLNATKFNIDPNRIGVCGGSAGGHLSLVLGTEGDDGDKNAQDPVDRTSDRVQAVVAYFPPVDMREWVGKMTDRFPALAFDPKLAESISPLLHVSPDDPPTLLIHGDKDTLVKLDNSQRMMAALKKANVPCDLIVMKGAGHGFGGQQAEDAAQSLIAWFDKYLKPPARSGIKSEPKKSRGNADTGSSLGWP